MMTGESSNTAAFGSQSGISWLVVFLRSGNPADILYVVALEIHGQGMPVVCIYIVSYLFPRTQNRRGTQTKQNGEGFRSELSYTPEW